MQGWWLRHSELSLNSGLRIHSQSSAFSSLLPDLVTEHSVLFSPQVNASADKLFSCCQHALLHPNYKSVLSTCGCAMHLFQVRHQICIFCSISFPPLCFCSAPWPLHLLSCFIVTRFLGLLQDREDLCCLYDLHSIWVPKLGLCEIPLRTFNADYSTRH